MPTILDDILRQQREGKTTPVVFGIPKGFDWYDGTYRSNYDPTTMGAVTGYLHAAPQANPATGQPMAQPDYNAIIETRNFRTWCRRRSDKKWVEVQSANLGQAGGNFPYNFGPGGGGSTPINRGNGVIGFKVPPAGQLVHWWPSARGVFTAGSMDEAYTQAEVRITNPAHKMVVGSGIDWWKNGSVGYVEPVGTNNPAGSMAGWDVLTGEWMTVGSYTSTEAEFLANLPPPLAGTIPDVDPPVEPPVTIGFTGTVTHTYKDGLVTKAEIK